MNRCKQLELQRYGWTHQHIFTRPLSCAAPFRSICVANAQSPVAPRDALLQQPVLMRLVQLLQQPQHGSVAEAAANMLGHCCTNASQVGLLLS
jgi:hypothetical protein